MMQWLFNIVLLVAFTFTAAGIHKFVQTSDISLVVPIGASIVAMFVAALGKFTDSFLSSIDIKGELLDTDVDLNKLEEEELNDAGEHR